MAEVPPAAEDDDGEFSEFDLIELFAERPPDPGRVGIGIGDDAAVVRAVDRVVTSVDTVVEGVHFRREYSTPEQIGIKAVGAALSDLAAMGAGAGGADVFLGLGAPRGTGLGFLRGIARGVIRAVERDGAALLGGDTVASPVLFLTVTVTAHEQAAAPLISRSGAKAGDLVVVTGELGAAQAGLWLLENPALPVSPELPPETRRELITRHLEARPRLAAGAALARAGASAMIDLSDGLVADLGHLARRSSTGPSGLEIRLDAGQIPSAPGAGSVAEAVGVDPLSPGLGGGEDYELAATLSPDRLDEATAALDRIGVPLTVIGEVRPAGALPDEAVTIFSGGERHDPLRGGFDHFG